MLLRVVSSKAYQQDNNSYLDLACQCWIHCKSSDILLFRNENIIKLKAETVDNNGEFIHKGVVEMFFLFELSFSFEL